MKETEPFTTQRRKVYILNRGPHDYSKAEKFGEIVYCTSGILDREDISQMHRILEVAMDRSHQDDLILLTSLSSLCSVACAMFAARHYRLNLLLFKDGKYTEKTIEL